MCCERKLITGHIQKLLLCYLCTMKVILGFDASSSRCICCPSDSRRRDLRFSGFTLVLLCLPACHYMNTAHTSRVKQFTSIRGWFVVSVLYQCCCRKTQGVFTRFFWPECLRVQSICHFLCSELYFLKEISKYVHVLKPNKKFVLLNL